jgi:hypothetical protein
LLAARSMWEYRAGPVMLNSVNIIKKVVTHLEYGQRVGVVLGNIRGRITIFTRAEKKYE